VPLGRLRRPAARAFTGGPALAPRSGRFAILGDLQPTSALERWRESNPQERRRVVREIARDRPDFVAALGDMVFCGSLDSQWRDLERVCEPLLEASVPVFPILGNHEYWVLGRRSLARFDARFPHLEGRRFYEVRYGPVALVFLDSNRRSLGAAAWRQQRVWLGERLTALDRDEGVRGVLLFAHHPPYTNSLVVGDSRHVQRDIVPLFTTARKTLAIFSGHVHSYEHFRRANKSYVVTGGGGAPRQRLSTGAQRRHADDLFAGAAVRSFHYLRATLSAAGLGIEMRALEKGEESFAPADAFALSFPA
jgi:3',5'-cyclic AMP phosphodiesterase CpdA